MFKNARSCDFWLWKDDYIDPRSKFVIPKLLGRITDLEHTVESSEKVETFIKEVNQIYGKEIRYEQDRVRIGQFQ